MRVPGSVEGVWNLHPGANGNFVNGQQAREDRLRSSSFGGRLEGDGFPGVESVSSRDMNSAPGYSTRLRGLRPQMASLLSSPQLCRTTALAEAPNPPYDNPMVVSSSLCHRSGRLRR
jgi:hypothetical protein